MSNAREIAKERLARGEIDKAQFDSLIAALGSDEPAAQQPVQQSEANGSLLGDVLLWGGGILLALLLFILFREGDSYSFNRRGNMLLLGAILAVGAGILLKSGNGKK